MLKIVDSNVNKLNPSSLLTSHNNVSQDSAPNFTVDVNRLTFEDLLQLGAPNSSTQVDDVCNYRQTQAYAGKRIDPKLLDEFTVNYIKDKWLLHYQSKSWRLWHTFERILALILLITFLPLLFLLGGLVKISSRGPAIFKQQRLGYLCVPFTIYKFRTMGVDAEANGPQWASQNDSRYTHIGRFLRSTRLDELPQLWNIVKGDMSLIGFRPIRLHFADMLNDTIPYYELRFFVKPGLTGWPQIWHDYAGTVEGQQRKFEFELYYLLHANIRMNIRIAVLTTRTMIKLIGQ